MKKIQIACIALFSMILVLSNRYAGYINVLTEGLGQSYLFQTQNAEFEFRTIPSKGRDIEMMEQQFKEFREKSPEFSELRIHRTFSRNPFKFWNWFDYLTNDQYDYPFQEEIVQAFD